jgi:prefoldin beta subunit
MHQLPKNLEQQLLQFQQLQKQAQTISQQRLQFEIQLKETEKALSELGKLGEKPEIYKSVGAFLIKAEKDPVEKELGEKKETLEVRIKTFKSQEEKYTEKLKSMKAEIESQLQGFTPTAG